jgi:hypothetical protein
MVVVTPSLVADVANASVQPGQLMVEIRSAAAPAVTASN